MSDESDHELFTDTDYSEEEELSDDNDEASDSAQRRITDNLVETVPMT